MQEVKQEWLSPEQVATMLNLTVVQVMLLIRAGKLPATRLSRKVTRINAESLNKFLEQASKTVDV